MAPRSTAQPGCASSSQSRSSVPLLRSGCAVPGCVDHPRGSLPAACRPESCRSDSCEGYRSTLAGAPEGACGISRGVGGGVGRRSRTRLVGETGFEPATSRSQSGRSTRLSYSPYRANQVWTRPGQAIWANVHHTPAAAGARLASVTFSGGTHGRHDRTDHVASRSGRGAGGGRASRHARAARFQRRPALNRVCSAGCRGLPDPRVAGSSRRTSCRCVSTEGTARAVPGLGARFNAQWTPTTLIVPLGQRKASDRRLPPADDFWRSSARPGPLQVQPRPVHRGRAAVLGRGRQSPADERPRKRSTGLACAYKAMNDPTALSATAEELRTRYSDTSWAKKASVWGN